MTAVLPKPKEKYWVSYIKQRIKNRKNFLGFISGQTGSGKSWSSIRICEELDPEFDVDRIVFGGLELMNLINSGKLTTGSAIVFEEVGVGMSNKNWQSVMNKMLSYLIQTFRHKRYILIMNSPYMDFVDASIRKLFHGEMETRGIDYKAKQVKLKPQLIQYNSRMKKFYYKRLKVIKPLGKIPIDIWKVDKPSEELLKAYEEKKTQYTTNLNKKIYDELEAVENKDKKKKELTEIQAEVLGMLEQGMNISQIAKERERSEDSIRECMQLIKKKGYKFKAVTDKARILYYKVIKP